MATGSWAPVLPSQMVRRKRRTKMSEQETLLFIQRLGAPLPLLADNTHVH